MSWNRLFIVCCSLIILFNFAGCKKVVEVRINVDPDLTLVSAIAAPGESLEWVATASDESFDVVFDSGLCTQKSPIHATYKNPAVCTIAPQTFEREKRSITHTYRLEGNVDGKPFRSPNYSIVVVPKPCPHCPTLQPGHCPYCRPAY
jgi:hypothetical protein